MPPAGDTNRAKRGVFATRSPDRPNPLGLHEVEIREIAATEKGQPVRLRVYPLEAIDGTPIVDVKSAG